MARGGKREGAGRKCDNPNGEKRKMRSLRATDEEWEKIQWFAQYMKHSKINAENIIDKIKKELFNVENAIKALKEKVNDRYGIEANDRDITINTCRNGKDVVWWTFGDDTNTEICIYVDTLEELDEDEIEEELACS